jgi:penicillin-binding protein 1A
MVPNLATGVWVGCEDRSARFKSITYGQGATAALPIWGYFMEKCYEDPDLQVSKDEFIKPEGFNIKVDCWSPRSSSTPTDSTAVDPVDDQNLDEFKGI